MSEALKVERRESRGKRDARRMRQVGNVPAILYGHQEEAVSLAVDAVALRTALRHGARTVELTGDVQTSALIKAMQWDAFHTEILHVDFARVSADERIRVMVPVHLRGDAPGARGAGVLEQPIHEVEIECLAAAIPDHVTANIASLELGHSIHANELILPPGVTMVTPGHEVVVHCILAKAEEVAPGVATGVEPEVIGRKPGEEEAAK